MQNRSNSEENKMRKKKEMTIPEACNNIVTGIVNGVNDWFDEINKSWSGTKKKKRTRRAKKHDNK